MAAKLTYKASLIPVADLILKEISKLIYNFLWKGTDKVKRKVISGDYKHGGLKNKQLLDINMKEVGGSELFMFCNFNKKQISELIIPDWYKTVFLVFLKDIKQSKYAGEIVWNNCNVLIQSKPVFNSTFYRTGIKYISDLFIKDTALASFNYWVDKGLPRSFIMTWYGLRHACLKLRSSISASSSGNGIGTQNT